MSDYTPTTEWVIAGWMKARASDGVTADVAVEEINRWLAEHDAQIVADVIDTERRELKQCFTLLASILYSHDGAVKVSDMDLMELDKYSIEISEDRINYTRTIKLVPYRKEENND